MTLLSALLLTLSAVYVGFISFFARGLRRLLKSAAASMAPASARQESSALPLVSVVVAARNEAARIRACLSTILKSRYPPGRFEVIVVDDASTDGTSDVVRRIERSLHHRTVMAGGSDSDDSLESALKLLRLEPSPVPGRNGKRAALETGISHARGEIILITDADCHVSPGWISAMAGCLTGEVGFVAGPVQYRYGRSMWEQIQALEFLGLVAMGAGGIGRGRPVICNGANLGIRADVYRSVGGFGDPGNRTAGQEELLMHTVVDAGWQVTFCTNPDAVVTTSPVPTLTTFIEQRIRWASQAPRLPGLALLAMLVGAFSFLALLPASALIALFAPRLWPAVGAAWLIKLLVDLTVLYPACRHFGRPELLRLLPLAELVHPAYIVLCSAAGFFGRYRWKDRPATS